MSIKRSATIKLKNPEIVFRNHKPVSVILDIKDYKKILDLLEDKESLEQLNEIKKRPLKFRKFTEFFSEID